MDELFQKIELRQQAIDRRLYDASAGKQLAPGVEVSGIGALLHLAHEDGRSDQRDMQRILELAASHTHQGGT